MINIYYNRKEMRLSFKGHAKSAPKGEDLVCAAASILAFTAMQAVEGREDLFFPSILQSDGEISISCNPKDGQIGRCKDILDTVFTGCEILANRYPEYVRTIKEV